MQPTGKTLTGVAGSCLALGLLISTYLGYSGDVTLAELGNLIMVMVLLLGVPVFLAGSVVWFYSRPAARELPPVL